MVVIECGLNVFGAVVFGFFVFVLEDVGLCI